MGPPTSARPLSPFVFNCGRTAARPDQDPSMSVISKAASAAAIFYGLSAASDFAQDTQVLPSIGIDSEDRTAGPVSSEILLRDKVAPLPSGTSDKAALLGLLPGGRSFGAGGSSAGGRDGQE